MRILTCSAERRRRSVPLGAPILRPTLWSSAHDPHALAERNQRIDVASGSPSINVVSHPGFDCSHGSLDGLLRWGAAARGQRRRSSARSESIPTGRRPAARAERNAAGDVQGQSGGLQRTQFRHGRGRLRQRAGPALQSRQLLGLPCLSSRRRPERMKAMALRPNAHDPQRPGAMRAGDRVKMYERLGIIGRPGRGRENRSGNDSTITRFGWKAQNKSLLLFAGEAYNVEQGVTNELFPNERDEEATPLPDACKLNATPEDDIDFGELDQPPPATARSPSEHFAAVTVDLVKFELFMRMLAPPMPACDLTKSGDCGENIVRGSAVFDRVYCSACHVGQLPLGPSSIAAVSAQRYANLFSDLLLHKMGSCPDNPDHTPS